MQFACGMLATTDARCLTNYVSEVLRDHSQNKLNSGKDIFFNPATIEVDLVSQNLSLLHVFLKEGGVPLVTPYLTWYPACGRPLAEVLANTKLAVIDDIHSKDRDYV